MQTVNGQRTWVFIWFMYRATAKAKGSRQKKRSFYGQADIKGLPPPYGQGVVIFSNKLTYLELFYHFIMGKIGPKFSHLVTVRAEGADPPLRSA